MIEANKPEINVDELMKKIRQEVERRQSYNSLDNFSFNGGETNSDFSSTETNSSYSSTPQMISVDFDYIEALINNAESRAGIRTKWPDGYNRFPFNVSKGFQKLAFKIIEVLFRDQREVNFNLLQAFKQSLLLNKQLIEQIANLQTQVKATDNRLNTVDGNVSATNNRLNTLNGLVNGTNTRLNAVDQRVEVIVQQTTTKNQYLQTVDQRVEAIAQQSATTNERLNTVDQCVKAITQQSATTNERLNTVDQRVEAIAQQSATTNERLNTVDQRVEAIAQQSATTDQHLQTVDQRVEAIAQQVTTIDEHLNTVDQRVEAIAQQVTTTDERLNTVDQRVEAIAQQVTTTDERLNTVDQRVEVIAQQVTTTDERLNTVDQRVEALTQQVTTADHRLNTVDQRVEAFAQQVTTTDERLEAIAQQAATAEQHLEAVDERVEAMDERHIKDDTYLKNDLAQQKRLISLFLEQARQRLPEPFNQEQLQTFVNEEQHLLDAFYATFTDEFRGTRKNIIEKLQVYLPFIAKANVGKQDSPILDVGCGRGEWLELLSKNGYVVQGLDINRVMIDQCRSRGLQVIEGDLISYLQFLPNASIGAITSFHLIEHLPFKVLIKLFDEAVRVLKPGGVAIFETPNPENLIVGACNFYLDPTHGNPIPPATAQFLLGNRGFCQVEIHRLHQMTENHNLDNAFLNGLLLGCQDYAVIGWKR